MLKHTHIKSNKIKKKKLLGVDEKDFMNNNDEIITVYKCFEYCAFKSIANFDFSMLKVWVIHTLSVSFYINKHATVTLNG